MSFPEGDWKVSVSRDTGGEAWWVGPVSIFCGIVLVIALISSCSQQSSPRVAQPTAPQRQSPSPQPQPSMHFVAIGAPTMPLPSPPPLFRGRAPDGRQVYDWQGRRWFLPPPAGHYAYLCVTNGLSWCWRTPPNSQAWACTRNKDGVQGWCWSS